MKRLAYLLVATTFILAVTSCASSREPISGGDSGNRDEADIRKAIESGRYIIKLERLYTIHGFLELRPRANYIIVDGRKAVINAAYVGRHYDIRPIAGINMRGNASSYEVTNKFTRGVYDIRMKVENEAAAFNVYLKINKNGTASASVNSIRINNARYRGYVVPLNQRVVVPLQEENDVI